MIEDLPLSFSYILALPICTSDFIQFFSSSFFQLVGDLSELRDKKYGDVNGKVWIGEIMMNITTQHFINFIE